MFLMNYLLDEFIAPGNTKSFFAKSKEKELAGLNRSFPHPPMIGATTTDWYSKDNSARQHAIRDLIVWFTAFDKQLTIGENGLKELLNNKVARRVY